MIRKWYVHMYICMYAHMYCTNEYLGTFCEMHVPSLKGAGHFNHKLPFAPPPLSCAGYEFHSHGLSISLHVSTQYIEFCLLLDPWSVIVRICTQCMHMYEGTYVCMYAYVYLRAHIQLCTVSMYVRTASKSPALFGSYSVDALCYMYASLQCSHLCVPGAGRTPLSTVQRLTQHVLRTSSAIVHSAHCVHLYLQLVCVSCVCTYMCTHVLNVCNTYIRIYVHSHIHAYYICTPTDVCMCSVYIQ